MTVALSALNFRDVGGLETIHGKPVRGGVLYRSEGPASFLAGHRRELAELNIKLVCDLRSGSERERAPNDWAGAARLLNIEMFGDMHGAKSKAMAALCGSETAEAARAIMLKSYARMPEVLLGHMPSIVDAIAGGEVPALIHCTAGKDRTGVLVGLLLSLAGVKRDAIVAEYLRSEIYERNLRASRVSLVDYFEQRLGVRLAEPVAGSMAKVEAAYLSATFDALDADWGSTDAYFAAAGVDKARREAFVRVLLGD